MGNDSAQQITVQAVVDGIRREHAQLKAAVSSLGEAALTVRVTEDSPSGWTAKDVVGHLLHYSGQIVFGLGANLRPPAYVVEASEALTAQQWNDRAVEFWADAALADVWAEFDHTVDLIVEAVMSRADNDLHAAATDTVPWASPGPLWRFIGYDTFLHEWPAHRLQIEQAAIRAKRGA